MPSAPLFHQNRLQNCFSILIRFWTRFWHDFEAILGVLADSGFQSRLERRLGCLLCDYRGQDGFNLGAKMVPSWSQNGTKIDAEIDSILDAILNRFFFEF